MPRYSIPAIHAWHFKTIKQRIFRICIYLFWSNHDNQDTFQERTKLMAKLMLKTLFQQLDWYCFFLELLRKRKSSPMMSVLKQTWYGKSRSHQKRYQYFSRTTLSGACSYCIYLGPLFLQPLQTLRSSLVSP